MNIFAKKYSLQLTGPKVIISLAAIVHMGLSHTMHYQGKVTDWVATPPELCSAIWNVYCKEVPGTLFWPMNWDLPWPIRSVQDVSSFASLPTNQSSSRMSNQNGLFQPIRTMLSGPITLCKFGFLCQHTSGIIRDQGGHFPYISGPSLCLRGAHFWFPLVTAYPGFATGSLEWGFSCSAP